MNFLMTDVVDEDRRTPLSPFELGDQMMLALRYAPRDGAEAKRADGVSGHAVETMCGGEMFLIVLPKSSFGPK